MPTNKQRREASRRHLERQLQRRQEHEAAAKRRTLIATVVGTLVLALVVVVAIVMATNDNKSNPAAATGTPSGSGSTAAKAHTTGPCSYQVASGHGLKDVGLPPDPRPTPAKQLVVDFATNRGNIQVTLDGRTAPCNVQSLAYLIQKKFYDNTPCPRVVNQGIFFVQCGSGGQDTSGGPTYTVRDENLAKADYLAGAIAMANIGSPDTASSQFFFITKDSNTNQAAGTGLGKQYTVVGHATKGLDILQKVAAGGDDGSSGQVGGGKPKLSLIFSTVKIISVVGGGPTPGVGPAPSLSTASPAG